jgi:pilus assembly protein Flp/PilA
MGSAVSSAQALARVRSLQTEAGANWPLSWTRSYWSPFRENIMKAIANFVGKLVKDEQGGEVLEYALIAGLIVVAAITVIGSVGTKVAARWTSLNSSL